MRPMCLVGLVTFSLLSSTFFASKISIFQNAFAKSNEGEFHGNATKDDVKGKKAPDKVETKKEEGDNKKQFDADRKLYKPTYSKIKADSKDSFTVYTEKHLYKPGENVTLAGSISTSLLSELDDRANLVKIEVKDNKRVVVASEEVEIDEDGEYTITFILPGDSHLGAYKVQAAIMVDHDLLKKLEPSVRAKLFTSVKFVVVNPVAFEIKVEDKQFNVVIASNSTSVKEFAFMAEQNIVSFKVKGDIGTKGVVQVTLPKGLLGEEVIVSIDGIFIAKDSNDVIVTSDTANEMTLEINYHHSEHTIELHGSRNVSMSLEESPSFMPVAFGSTVAVIAIAGVFLSVKYFSRQSQKGKMEPRGRRLFGFQSSSLGQEKSVDFLCMTCGTKHGLEACPNCGSKLKKAEF